MELGPWFSVRMGRYWYRAETEPVGKPPTPVALKRAVMLHRPWPMALSGQRKMLVLFARNWLIPSTERCCGLIRPPAMGCPAILTTTVPIRGRHGHVFGRWDCAIHFAWACGPIRAVIFHPTATPGS